MVAHVRVDGVVQGVGFRWFAREAARRRQLRGWVRNCEGGSVELAVSGPEHDVRDFLGEIRHGPPGARVRDVHELSTAALSELPAPFSILR